MSELFLALSEKGSTLKEKNLLPLGANSLLLEKSPFQKSFGMKYHAYEVTKVDFLAMNGGKSNKCCCFFCLFFFVIGSFSGSISAQKL